MQVMNLYVHNLRVNYGNLAALDIAHLELTGNIVALLGHNGAGKSTLIKTALDLLPHTPGSLCITDRTSGRTIPAREMAFCPETGSVFEDITVAEYIALWCRLRHRDPRYYRKAGRHYIEALEVEPLLARKGRELSKGQCRRVQTAIGFLTKPKLFLFDEPFDGLDVQKTQELTEIIQHASADISFLISSHRMDVMERLADHAVVLDQGRVAAHGSIDQTCDALAGRSALITHASNPDDLCRALRIALPKALVSHVGSQVSVTWPDLDEQFLKSWVQKFDQNGALVLSGRASLTDAMNFHLRHVGYKSTGL